MGADIISYQGGEIFTKYNVFRDQDASYRSYPFSLGGLGRGGGSGATSQHMIPGEQILSSDWLRLIM